MLSRRRPLTGPADRVRFAIAAGDLYSGPLLQWQPDPFGSALSSLLPDGRHAPVLDVDRPITVTSTPTGTRVRFEGRFAHRAALLGLTQLVLFGLVHESTWAEVDRLRAVTRLGRLRCQRAITVDFGYEVLAAPSKTPGHHHLLSEASMAWDEASPLAYWLGRAHLAGHRDATDSSASDFMYVELPPSDGVLA